MTALALPAPRLLRADILKFRRRRGLAVVVGVLTIVAITLTYAIIELFHVANAAKYGAAGGLDNLANGTNLVATLGAAAAAIVGGVAAVGDRDAPIHRRAGHRRPQRRPGRSFYPPARLRRHQSEGCAEGRAAFTHASGRPL